MEELKSKSKKFQGTPNLLNSLISESLVLLGITAWKKKQNKKTNNLTFTTCSQWSSLSVRQWCRSILQGVSVHSDITEEEGERSTNPSAKLKLYWTKELQLKRHRSHVMKTKKQKYLPARFLSGRSVEQLVFPLSQVSVCLSVKLSTVCVKTRTANQEETYLSKRLVAVLHQKKSSFLLPPSLVSLRTASL